MEIGLLGAFLGGFLTLLSPCSVMLLPAFFSYAFGAPAQLLARTGWFYLGLITTLVPLGVLAGTLGAFVQAHRDGVVAAASVLVILLGLVMMAGITLPMPALRTPGGTGVVSVYLLGTVYGLAGVCAGPLLGAALTFAAMGGNALYGGVVLLVFAAGMVVPLIVLALLWQRLPFVRKLVEPRTVRVGRWSNTWTGLVGGALTAGIGVLLLLTGGTASLGGVLGATDQFRLESWIWRVSSAVSDLWVVVLAALGFGAGALAWRRHRREVAR